MILRGRDGEKLISPKPKIFNSPSGFFQKWLSCVDSVSLLRW